MVGKIIRMHQVSFKNAFAGLRWALMTQPNFRIHALLSLSVLAAGYFFRITRSDMLIIIFMIIIGFVVEMLNTSIEAVTDLVTSEWRLQAKTAKDVAAGMMLLVAIGAVCIAAYIFFPYIVGQAT